MRLLLGLVGVCLAAGTAGADLTVTATTTPNGGTFAPKNVVAVWIEDQAGTFVKTIQRWSAVRTSHLVAWIAKAGANDADAVSGATRLDHLTPLTITWDLKDKTNAVVPDGTYTIRMELADSNSTQPAQNHQGTFTFVKGTAAQNQPGLSNGGFVNVTIDFQPINANCNNGVVDPGETCDPGLAGSCPTTCAVAADACMPNVLVGAAATCSAACEVQPITTCANGDGCCPAGCDGMDDDCTGGGTSGGQVDGGCAAGGDGYGLGALGLLALVGVSRRRRR